MTYPPFIVAAVKSIANAVAYALSRGRLDVPYCLHPDNAGRTESRLDADGWLRWSRTGAMPISPTQPTTRRISSSDLLASLSYVERRYDTSRLGPDPAPTTPIRSTS